jgi:hypothetical protein
MLPALLRTLKTRAIGVVPIVPGAVSLPLD